MYAWACPLDGLRRENRWGEKAPLYVDPPPILPYIRASNFHRPARRARSHEKLLSMANTPGSKKAVRKIARRTEVNTARRSRVRTFLRKFDEALTSGDAAAAKDAFVKAQSELMRAVTKGVVHKNTGSRKVSRLAAQLKKMSAA
jgi:small subunit ribosomal protein S20